MTSNSVVVFHGNRSTDEGGYVEYNPGLDRVSWHITTLWDRSADEQFDYCSGNVQGQVWLEALAEVCRSPVPSELCITVGANSTNAVEAAFFLHHFGASFPGTFLDSFSVIENGEASKRSERTVKKSELTKALLNLSYSNGGLLSRVTSPREFEVLVSAVLAECGFDRVQLRRYVKDGGADLVAILASGKGEETVVVEVKHGKRPVSLATLDRLNGVRDRLNAHRALLVSSAHVSREAITAYVAQENYLTARTFAELTTILRNSNDWRMSPHGLWTKADEENTSPSVTKPE